MKLVAQYLIFVIAGIVAASWFVRFGPDERRRAAVYTAVAAAALALLVGQVIQHYYYHPRPFVAGHFMPLLHHSADTSFPSDHTTAAFGMASGAGLYRARLGLLLLILVVITAFSRVYVGVHYPADVGAGAAIGVIAAFALRLAYPVIEWLDAVIVVRVVPESLR